MWGPPVEGTEVTVESGGNFEDYKLVYIRFLSCHLFGPENHGKTWKGWERSGEKGLIISDNQAQTWLNITINDTSIGDLPLIITISDTCKNQPKRLDFDNTINLSSLIVILERYINCSHTKKAKSGPTQNSQKVFGSQRNKKERNKLHAVLPTDCAVSTMS